MKKPVKLGAMLLSGFLLIPGNLVCADPLYAQGGAKPLTDQQYQELQKKRQEQWQYEEQDQKRRGDTGQRLQDAQKRQKDAAKRQKAAEQGLRELEK
jgi:hypothetical protein